MGKPGAAETLDSLKQSVRGRRVLLDRDAAKYFQVCLSALSATVERRPDLFPADALLVLRGCEAEGFDRRSGVKRPRRRVRAFTELGIELLAGALRSKRASAHSVESIRRFFADLDRIFPGREAGWAFIGIRLSGTRR